MGHRPRRPWRLVTPVLSMDSMRLLWGWEPVIPSAPKKPEEKAAPKVSADAYNKVSAATRKRRQTKG